MLRARKIIEPDVTEGLLRLLAGSTFVVVVLGWAAVGQGESPVRVVVRYFYWEMIVWGAVERMCVSLCVTPCRVPLSGSVCVSCCRRRGWRWERRTSDVAWACVWAWPFACGVSRVKQARSLFSDSVESV